VFYFFSLFHCFVEYQYLVICYINTNKYKILFRFILFHFILFYLHKSIPVGRQKGEDKSLSFQVVPAHPLLHISLEGMKTQIFKSPEIQLLQGQILESVLTIRNDGFAPATDIFIKFSHPNFVLAKFTDENNGNGKNQVSENPFELVPMFGKSGTVLKLTDMENNALLPGGELKYFLYFTMTDIGRHRINILSSYALYSNNENDNLNLVDDDSAYDADSFTPIISGSFGPNSKFRTSILSFQVRTKRIKYFISDAFFQCISSFLPSLTPFPSHLPPFLSLLTDHSATLYGPYRTYRRLYVRCIRAHNHAAPLKLSPPSHSG
jgi:hypothetical protein